MKNLLAFFRRDEQLFDGEILGERIRAFLTRTNNALSGVEEALQGFDVDGIEVSLAVDAGLNVSFAGIGGQLDRTRTFTFSLKPKKK